MIIWKKYAPLGAMALTLVECSYIGRSTADPSPVSLKYKICWNIKKKLILIVKLNIVNVVYLLIIWNYVLIPDTCFIKFWLTKHSQNPPYPLLYRSVHSVPRPPLSPSTVTYFREQFVIVSWWSNLILLPTTWGYLIRNFKNNSLKDASKNIWKKRLSYIPRQVNSNMQHCNTFTLSQKGWHVSSAGLCI